MLHCSRYVLVHKRSIFRTDNNSTTNWEFWPEFLLEVYSVAQRGYVLSSSFSTFIKTKLTYLKQQLVLIFNNENIFVLSISIIWDKTIVWTFYTTPKEWSKGTPHALQHAYQIFKIFIQHKDIELKNIYHATRIFSNDPLALNISC